MNTWLVFFAGVAVGWLVIPHLVPILKMTYQQGLGPGLR